jgi:HlyD family secretion protein
MKNGSSLLAALLLLSACGNSEKAYDATGTFEATETTVCAEQSGQLTRFNVAEGDSLMENEEVGLVDTVQISLQIAQTMATRQVYNAQRPDVRRQLAALQEQLIKARREQQRYTELVADGAAPRKLQDDARSQVLVLERQLDALKSSLGVEQSTLTARRKTADTQIDQLTDQLRKCHIVAPLTGTVLEKYVERGEFVAMGKPLFKMADTRHMFLRAYVTSAQLEHIKVGQRVKVATDYGDGRGRSYNGTVTWISTKSEFTPKTILTDDERADLVYAVKISVVNDGYIKIGMYGQVKFTE